MTSSIYSADQPEAGPLGLRPGSDPLPTRKPNAQPQASVLLVEDDFLLRSVSVGTLNDLGYQAFEVADAQQALSLLAAHSEIKVLMTDVNLPGMDGKALATEAKRIRPELRVLFVTGYGPKVVKDVDFSDGSIGYLSKPYQHKDLERALKRLLI
jgi:CheY-like chemotaxis protein